MSAESVPISHIYLFISWQTTMTTTMKTGTMPALESWTKKACGLLGEAAGTGIDCFLWKQRNTKRIDGKIFD